MQQQSQQPVTHSILRNSQARRQSSGAESVHDVNNNPTNQRTKYEGRIKFQYLKSSQTQNHKLNPVANEQNTQSQYVRENKDLMITGKKENIVVCQSLPRTKPKYSFTFGQLPGKSTQTAKNSTRQSLHQAQQAVRQPQSERRSQPRDVRRDMDVCLYTIADKLNQEQSSLQTRQLVSVKLGEGQNSYKPSISQLRRNKLMQRSIHRIHPEIVDEYIETVYKEYDIPNPIGGSQSRGEKMDRRDKEREKGGEQLILKGQIKQGRITEFRVKEDKENVIGSHHHHQNGESQQAKQYQSLYQVVYNKRAFLQPQQYKQLKKQPSIIEQKQQRVVFTLNQNQKEQKPNQQQSNKKIIRQDYSLYNTKHNRRNNLISSKQVKGREKRKFLNLTLSREKDLEVRGFQSPSKLSKSRREQSGSERSRQVRKSSSQKKILQIKKNIASWKQSQHQFAERYSYLESPYQMIRPKDGGRKQQMEGRDSSGRVNVVVRPFEQLLKPTQQTNYNTLNSQAINTTTQYVSNSSHFNQQSKYIQSFITPEGEVLQQFRYCILCEQQILSANIARHQEKCIGWIDDRGELVMFGDLYKIQEGEKLAKLMRTKINQIRDRITKIVDKQKNKNTPINNQSPTSESLDTRILQSVQNFIWSHKKRQQNKVNVNRRQDFRVSYRTVERLARNQPLQLIEETKKLYWFVKLLETYEHGLDRNVVRSQQLRSQNINKKEYTSTKAKHNRSMTLVEEQHQQHKEQFVVSEFNGVRNSYC